MKLVAKQLNEVVENIETILKSTDWDVILPEPDLSRVLIEGQAKLIEANKKIKKVVSAVEKSCNEI